MAGEALRTLDLEVGEIEVTPDYANSVLLEYYSDYTRAGFEF